MNFIFSMILALTFSNFVYAGPSDPFFDRRQPNEPFSQFFARITRGGAFSGIRLPPIESPFVGIFDQWIWRPTWN